MGAKSHMHLGGFATEIEAAEHYDKEVRVRVFVSSLVAKGLASTRTLLIEPRMVLAQCVSWQARRYGKQPNFELPIEEREDVQAQES